MTTSNILDIAVVDEPPVACGVRPRMSVPVSSLADHAPARASDDTEGWPARLLPATLVCVAHAGLLWWMAETLLRHEPTVFPPAVVGMLVTPPTVTEPAPLPVDATPPPAPKPVAKPKPIKPPPKAAPSERAVSAPPPEPPAPAQLEAAAPEPAPAPAPAPPAAEPKEAPATPPRSDAAHLNNPAPVYPSGSQRLGEQGTVLLDVYILADGTVGELKLKRTSGHARLDQAALDAVRRWRYQPARRGNEPIPCWYVQPIHFSLDN